MIMIWGSLDCQWSSGSPASGPRVTVSGLAREGPRSQGTQRQSFSLPTMLILRLLTTNQSEIL